MAILVRKCFSVSWEESATKLPQVEEQGGRAIEKCGCGRKRWTADGRKSKKHF